MEKLFISFFALLLSVNIMAQSIKVENDKFRKTNIVYTSYESMTSVGAIAATLGKKISYRFGKEASDPFMEIKWIRNGVYSINEGDVLTFLDNSGNTYTFYSKEYAISEKGGGSTGLSYSALLGITFYVYGDMSVFNNTTMTAVRIYTNYEYLDFEINKKNAKKLSKTYSLFKEALK